MAQREKVIPDNLSGITFEIRVTTENLHKTGT